MRYRLKPLSVKALYYYGGGNFANTSKDFTEEGLRLDIAYNLGETKLAKFIYYCGVTD